MLEKQKSVENTLFVLLKLFRVCRYMTNFGNAHIVWDFGIKGWIRVIESYIDGMG